MRVQGIQNNNYNKQSFGWLRIEDTPKNRKRLLKLKNGNASDRKVYSQLQRMKREMEKTEFFHIYIGDNFEPKILSTKDAFWGTFETEKSQPVEYKPLENGRTEPMEWNTLSPNYGPYCLHSQMYDIEDSKITSCTIDRLDDQTAEFGLVPYEVTYYAYDYGQHEKIAHKTKGSILNRRYTRLADIDKTGLVEYSMAMELEELAKIAQTNKNKIPKRTAAKKIEPEM